MKVFPPPIWTSVLVLALTLSGWTSCTEEPGTPPLPDPWTPLWTFHPRAGVAGAGVGPWSCSQNVVCSSGDSLWLLHGKTGIPLHKTYLPRTWTDGSYPGTASLQQGDWAYLLGPTGILMLHLPTLQWSEVPWPSPEPAQPDETQWVEPALFAGPGNSVVVVTKSMGMNARAAGASTGTSPENSAGSNLKTVESPTNGWTSTAWVWHPDRAFAQGKWELLWKQGWRGDFVGGADGIALSPGAPGDPPTGRAGWWRHRAPNYGTLVHSSGSTVALRGNPVAHPPVVLNPGQVAVLMEHEIESYSANGTRLWSITYSDSSQLDQTLWLGWALVGRRTSDPTISVENQFLWVKGSDDQLWLVRGSDGWVERRWNRAGWSPSGHPKLDANGTLWYTAEGALWRVTWDRLDRMVDAQCTGSPAVWNEPGGTAVAVRDGMKISAYLCSHP